MTIKSVLVCTFLLSILPPCVVADKIILKDGTVEQSDHVWESEDYYHFILHGTKNVEIRYAKSIVDHIERAETGSKSRIISTVPEKPEVRTTKPPEVNSLKNGDFPAPTNRQSADQTPIPEGKMAKDHKGIAFYDPRRKDRYWATRQSRHNTLNDALSALANQYGQSPRWVESNMGEANDLGAIHRNLIEQRKKELSGLQPANPATPAAGKEEKKLEAPPQKPTHNSGVEAPKPLVRPGVVLQRPELFKGIPFYNPRRPEKYWSSKMMRHNTLKAAIKSLAEQYHVSENWISAHMGDTNDLAEIHRNIQNSLEAVSKPSN